MKSLTQSYVIHAPINLVWDALVNPHAISQWSGAPAVMSDMAHEKFSLWDGTIWGKNVAVVQNKKLVQEWYSKEDVKWEHPSVVTFTLRNEDKNVVLELQHTDIPDENFKEISDGWKEYYLGPLKKYVESV